MSGLLLFAWIMVLAVIIATIVIFFKNRKEKNEFDDFSWESEKRRNFLIEQMMRRDIK